MMHLEREYIYLDSVEDREKLISKIHQVRQDVRAHVDTIPENLWYVERYHGWTLGAMLGHLNFVDNMALLQVKAALLHFSPVISIHTVNRMNDFMARVYRHRLITSSLRGMEKNETRIADFVTHLPVRQFSKQVFYPVDNQYKTIERIIQDYFVHHWHWHLQTMIEVEQLQRSSEQEES